MSSKRSSENLLDKKIDAVQKKYNHLFIELNKCTVQLRSLFEKRYPQGRFYDEFYNEANIKRNPVDSSGR